MFLSTYNEARIWSTMIHIIIEIKTRSFKIVTVNKTTAVANTLEETSCFGIHNPVTSETK